MTVNKAEKIIKLQNKKIKKKKDVLDKQKEAESYNITLNNIALKPLEEFAGSIKCKSLRSLI